MSDTRAISLGIKTGKDEVQAWEVAKLLFPESEEIQMMMGLSKEKHGLGLEEKVADVLVRLIRGGIYVLAFEIAREKLITVGSVGTFDAQR